MHITAINVKGIVRLAKRCLKNTKKRILKIKILKIHKYIIKDLYNKELSFEAQLFT